MGQVITDEAGRRITLRRVGVLEQLRLYKAVGPELSLNGAYMGFAMFAASVEMIDDVPVPFPASEAAVEALLEKLGSDGVAAIASASLPLSMPKILAEAGN